MNSEDKDSAIPKKIISILVEPILKIDPLDKENRNKKVRTLFDNLIQNNFEKCFRIILKNIDLLLNQKFKIYLIKYLTNKSPPEFPYYLRLFKELLGILCQEGIKLRKHKDYFQLSALNDISIEYFLNGFDIYSIKFYYKNGSLNKLFDESKNAVGKELGYQEDPIRPGSPFSRYDYLYEFPKSFEYRTSINDKIWLSIFFNQNDPNIFSQINVYFAFWTPESNDIRVWEDISISSIKKIYNILKNFISIPNIELISLNKSDYINKSPLPEEIVNFVKLLPKKQKIKSKIREKGNPIVRRIDEFLSEEINNVDICFSWSMRIQTYFNTVKRELGKYHPYLAQLESWSKYSLKDSSIFRRDWKIVTRILINFLKDLRSIIIQDSTIDYNIDLHPKVKEVSLDLFNNGHYSEAIFEAAKELIQFIKEKSKLREKKAFNLMGKVFNENNPIIKLNNLKNDSDKDEQKGFRFLFQGAVMGIRNPKAHETIKLKDPNRALEYLSFISLLFRRVEEGTIEPKIEEIKQEK